MNDLFRAQYGENVTAFHLEIFNRWGQKVFETKSINYGLNGSFNGIQQPMGEYVGW